ncbi:uncharacterized protein [Apostichopus japonicus]|uniref:uncharacterized protein n=1 Tax=Stichopus japonicus TaxID=307972 RepID=UPI003AB3AD1E
MNENSGAVNTTVSVETIVADDRSDDDPGQGALNLLDHLNENVAELGNTKGISTHENIAPGDRSIQKPISSVEEDIAIGVVHRGNVDEISSDIQRTINALQVDTAGLDHDGCEETANDSGALYDEESASTSKSNSQHVEDIGPETDTVAIPSESASTVVNKSIKGNEQDNTNITKLTPSIGLIEAKSESLHSILKHSTRTDSESSLHQTLSNIAGKTPLRTLMMRLKQPKVGEEKSTDDKQKKKVRWDDDSNQTKISSTSEPRKKPISAVNFGGLARTVTTITGLKRWKLKTKEKDTQNSFEKYHGHLRVVQEHLRQEKTETPLAIRIEVKTEVLPILANVVKAYKKELVGKHRLLREANFKYEKLKSEVQDGFL